MKSSFVFRKAQSKDIPAIIHLIWDDKLRQEDSELPKNDLLGYESVFNKITADENQFLLIVEDVQENVIATSHLTLLRYMPFFDRRVLVEYVRVAKAYQGQGVGRQMFSWIEQQARSWKASRIQLTTDKRRKDARLFYESLGYVATHEGMKLFLYK